MEMNVMNVINILAILCSPLIAVLVTVYLQDRKEKRGQKLYILGSLMGTRHAQLTDENVRSLNMVDMVFFDKPRIRMLWHEYFDMLNNQGLNNEVGWAQWNKKRLELITEMGKSLGYEKAITHLDVDRVYVPLYFGKSFQRNEEIANEFLIVLRRLASVLESRPNTPLEESITKQ